MSHNHSEHSISNSKLLFSIILNMTISTVELIGGFISGSLALVSDSIHNFADGFSLIVSFVTHRIAKRDSNERYTFGYKRAEILAALFNASFLLAISVILIKESIVRIINPIEINFNIMLYVGLVGLIANIISVFLLHKDAKHNINIKSSYLHLMSDTLSSVAVVMGALILKFIDFPYIDPIITMLISIYIINEAYKIVKESVDILMQKNTDIIDINEIKKDIEKINHIDNVHHIHIWRLNQYDVFFEAHVDVECNMNIKDIDILRKSIESLLREKYGIIHTTIQVEHYVCENKNTC